MDGLQWKTLLNWMIWGYHYFWKHPHSNGISQSLIGNTSSIRVHFAASHVRLPECKTYRRAGAQGIHAKDLNMQDFANRF